MQVLTKTAILDRVIRIAMHRERMMKYYKGRMTMDRLEAISDIIRTANMSKGKDLDIVSVVILKLKYKFEEIAPGKSSKYYNSYQKNLSEIFSLCESNLSNNK